MSPFICIEKRDLKGLAAALVLTTINTRSPSGMSLLHVAAGKHGSIEMTEELIRRGIDVNLMDEDSATALRFAVAWSREDVAEILINAGARLDLADEHGNQPLWYAVNKPFPNHSLIKMLMTKGADAHHVNRYGKSPLDIARNRNRESLENILNGDM